jgi:histone H3/H4
MAKSGSKSGKSKEERKSSKAKAKAKGTSGVDQGLRELQVNESRKASKLGGSLEIDGKTARGTLRPPQIRNMARRAGCAYVGYDCYDEVRRRHTAFLREVVFKTMNVTACARKKTVTMKHVLTALESLGRTAYGYGPVA